MTGEQYMAWIAGRYIGHGRDAGPVVEGGMFGYTARARSRDRGRWLTSRPFAEPVHALADLWELCLAELVPVRRKAVQRDSPLFNGSDKQVTLGDVLRG